MTTNGAARILPAFAIIASLVASCGGNDSTSTATDASTGRSTTPATTSSATTDESTTIAASTTQPDPDVDVSLSYTYEPPDGYAIDFNDSFPAMPPDPVNFQLGMVDAHGVVTDTGDFDGQIWYVYGSTEHPTGFGTGGIAASALALFSGTVAPCGTGTMVFAATYLYPPDLEGSGTWRVLPGYGTGDLANVTGSGTSANRDGIEAGAGELEGTIRCDGPAATNDVNLGTTAVEFGWSYAEGSNIVDPGTNWTDEGDIAKGHLGMAHGHSTMVFTGDVAGASKRIWLAIAHPDGWLAAGGTRTDLFQFSGSVAGCGEGTMILRGTASFGRGAESLATMVTSDYTWEIVEGFGSGGLAAATGSGHGHTEESAVTGTATLEGTISCDA